MAALRLDDFQPSDNVEDRRDQGTGGGGFRIGGGHIGIGGIVVVLVLSYVTGVNPLALLGVYNAVNNGGGQTVSTRPGPARHDDSEIFVAKVLRATEETWPAIFAGQTNGARYTPTTVVLFRGETRSGCGAAESAMGPFYCPADKKVYLDTEFFDEMRSRFHACPETEGACAFAQAYVIAHEVGHHVQDLLGILTKVHQMEQQAGSPAEANHLSVGLELQADCLAGVWAANTQDKLRLEQGDIDVALQTANAIGDDTLQRAARGRVVPDSFTHGTSEQRKHWLTVGLQTGQISECMKTFQQ